MKITNGTIYQTTALRAIILRAYAFIKESEGPLPQWQRVTWQVTYSRTRHYSGFAYYHGTLARLCLPHPATRRQSLFAPQPIATETVARLVWHEAMHLYGFTHKQYPTWPPHTDFIAGLPERVAVQQPKAKPVLTLTEKRSAKLEALETRTRAWQTKAKRAATALKKLAQQRRHLERALAKAASPAPLTTE